MSPFTIRPAYVDGDYVFVVTCDAMGSETAMDSWTLAGVLYDSDGDEVTSDVTMVVLDAAELTLTVSILGQELAYGDYSLVIRRTNADELAVVYTGTLEVVNPLNQLAWGKGF